MLVPTGYGLRRYSEQCQVCPWECQRYSLTIYGIFHGPAPSRFSCVLTHPTLVPGYLASAKWGDSQVCSSNSNWIINDSVTMDNLSIAWHRKVHNSQKCGKTQPRLRSFPALCIKKATLTTAHSCRCTALSGSTYWKESFGILSKLFYTAYKLPFDTVTVHQFLNMPDLGFFVAKPVGELVKFGGHYFRPVLCKKTRSFFLSTFSTPAK